MADNSSEKKKDSTPEGGVFAKQPSTDNEVIGLSHNPSKSPKKKEKRRRTRSSSSLSSSSSRSKSPRKKGSRRKHHKNKKRRRHIPLPVHQIRLLQADLHHRPLSILHLAEDFRS